MPAYNYLKIHGFRFVKTVREGSHKTRVWQHTTMLNMLILSMKYTLIKNTLRDRLSSTFIRARTFPPYNGAYFTINGLKVFLRINLYHDKKTEKK